MDNWIKEDYLKFREQIMKKTFETAYYAEVLHHLDEWNSNFDLK